MLYGVDVAMLGRSEGMDRDDDGGDSPLTYLTTPDAKPLY